MSAQLFFSNSPAILLERLSDNLDFSDPFRSPRIATPTPAMKRWVQLRLAEKRGIVANVDFLQLERMLWRRLEELDLEHVVEGRKPARLLDEHGIQLLILALLRADPPPEARAYLDPEGGGRSELYVQRLCQLSRKLAGFFREYEYSRVREHGHEGLAGLWMRGEDCFQAYLAAGAPAAERARVAALERWQKRIYHELFRLGGLRDRLGERTGQYRYTLPQYAEMVLSQARKPAAPGRPAPAYHLFGLSQISPFHRSLIQRLADEEGLKGRQARFYIYSLNPCAEYWEDVLTPGERLRQQANLFRTAKFSAWRDLDETEKAKLRLPDEAIQAEELHLEENENPLLSRWGKPGRENIQLWCQVTQYAFSECFRESGARTVLAAVQDAVLHRRGRLPDAERAAQDDSLRILACPEIHREAETVLHDILDALLDDPGLRPDEIAVLAPDMEKYRYVLSAVFGRAAEGDPGHVPFNLADTSAATESDYARAVRQLFGLALGRFSRKEMFALAANPCFKEGPGSDAAALQAWSAWTSRLNIFHAYDGEDKRRRGYAPDPLHTWSHGLDRLVLGTVMEAPPEDDPRHFDSIVPFADGNSADRELLARFLGMVQGLHRDLAPFRDPAPRPWGAWVDLCEAVFDHYLQAPEDEPLEAYVRAELRGALTGLRELDAADALAPASGAGEVAAWAGAGGKTAAGTGTDGPDGGGRGEGPGVAFAAVRELILARLEGLKAGREPHLAGGVNVAGLGALRSLPFKIIYVLGLGEGEFPEEDGSSTLDLRRSRRVIGDVDPAARNRYLFLETLLCATGKLRLSYVCRDPQQGRAFQMGSVLHELVDYLEECVLAPGPDGSPPRFRPVQVPLLARDPSLFAAGRRAPWDPPRNPFREDRLLAWLEERRAVPDLARRARSAGGAPARDLAPAPPPPPRETGAEPTALPLDDFRLFLENPARYALRRRLLIRDLRDEDPMDQEDEPFFCPPPAAVDLLRRLAYRRLASAEGSREACRAWFAQAYANLGLRGQMPAGPYRELDQERLWKTAEAALDGIDALFADLREDGKDLRRLPNLVLGDGFARGLLPRMRDLPALRLPPARLRAAGRELELHGELPAFYRDAGSGACSAVVFLPGDFKPRFLLPAALFYAAALLTASEAAAWLAAAPFTVRYVYKDKQRFAAGNWCPFRMDRAQAEAWLGGLAEAMLAGAGFDALPFDAIQKVLAPQNHLVRGIDYAAALREELEEDDEPEWGAFPPPDSEVLLAPRVPDDAEAKIRARLGPFFNFRPAGPLAGSADG
jgi:exodeoxyribonuclease V gamma subunit